MGLKSKQELYEYLLTLSAKLTGRGAEKLGRAVITASRHAAGMSTEFLGESRIALREVAKDKSGILTHAEYTELSAVLKQIDSAFSDRR